MIGNIVAIIVLILAVVTMSIGIKFWIESRNN